MSGATWALRGRAARRRARCSRRSCPGSSSTGRRGCRDAAARRPLQPYRELRRLWGKSAVDVEGTTAVYRLAPPVVAAALVAAVLLVPVAAVGAELGRRPRRARARRAARAGALRRRRRLVGRRERLRADGREPRPDDLGLRRDRPRPLASRSPALIAGHDRHAGDGRRRPPGAAAGRIPALALAAVGVRGRRDRRDRPPAGRQPRHPPRADDDPRGPAARVRRPRPRVAAVGGRGAALARARARGAGVPAAPEQSVAGSSRRSRSCSSRSAAALALTESLVAKMRILLVPRLLGGRRGRRAARDRHLAGRERRDRRRGALGARRARPARRRHSAALDRRRARHGAGARARRDRARRGDRSGRRRRRRARSAVRAAALAALFLWLVAADAQPAADPRRQRVRSCGPALAVRARADADLARAVARPRVDRNAERAVLALVAFGLVSVAMRRATLFQVIGIVLVENGLALAALELPGAPSLADRARRRARPDADRARRGASSTSGSSPSSAPATPRPCGACVTDRELLAAASSSRLPALAAALVALVPRTARDPRRASPCARPGGRGRARALARSRSRGRPVERARDRRRRRRRAARRRRSASSASRACSSRPPISARCATRSSRRRGGRAPTSSSSTRSGRCCSPSRWPGISASPGCSSRRRPRRRRCSSASAARRARSRPAGST